jgi:hypothetical protein
VQNVDDKEVNGPWLGQLHAGLKEKILKQECSPCYYLIVVFGVNRR